MDDRLNLLISLIDIHQSFTLNPPLSAPIIYVNNP